jgi:hypothetical protein
MEGGKRDKGNREGTSRTKRKKGRVVSFVLCLYLKSALIPLSVLFALPCCSIRQNKRVYCTIGGRGGAAGIISDDSLQLCITVNKMVT